MIIKTIPSSSRFLSTYNKFSAAFNVPVLGSYGFSVAANTFVNVLKLNRQSVYLIERGTIVADIDEGEYLRAQGIAGAIVPAVQLFNGKNRIPCYSLPLPIGTYYDNSEINTYVLANENDDYLQATVTGVLGQTPALVGIMSISISVSLSMYEITDRTWKDMYKKAIDSKTGFFQ